MESRPEGTNSGDTDTQGAVLSAITSHPWWRSPVFGAAVVPETAAKAPIGQSQTHGNAREGGDANKEIQNIGNGSGYFLSDRCILCMQKSLTRVSN